MRFIIGFFIVIMFLVSCNGLLRSAQTEMEGEKLFKIRKVKKLHSIYVIDAERNDSLFTILYPKINSDSNTLKIGRTLKFNIKRIYPRKNFISYLETHSYQVGNYIISLNRRNHWSIYTDTTAQQQQKN